MEVGILMPYFMFLIRTLLDTADIILFRFLITWGTHQENAGSFSKLLLIAYSAISNGLYSFKSASGINDSDPSLNLVRTSYPFVVIFLDLLPSESLIYPSDSYIASSVFLYLWTWSNILVVNPSESTCSYMLRAILLEASCWTVPYIKMISYILVSNILLWLKKPTALPSGHRDILTTLAATIPFLYLESISSA